MGYQAVYGYPSDGINRVMDALNRYRFGTAVEVLAEWESASNVFGPVQLHWLAGSP